MIENYFLETTDTKHFTANSGSPMILTTKKEKRQKSYSFMIFISLFMMLFFAENMNGQTTLWSTGFETGNSSTTLSSSNGTFTLPTTGGNLAANSVKITGPTGGSKTYDGSVITNTALSFTAGKYYVVTVYSKVAIATGILRIMKSLTATNTGMNAATGSDILLNSSSIYNVTSSSYVKYTAGFTVASNETKFIGFQLYSSGINDAQMVLDDISIIEYNSVQPENYCTPTYANGPGTSDKISNVTLGTLNNPSGSSASPYYTFYNAVAVPNLQLSSTASVSVSLGSDANQYVGVWVDFNQDGTFQATEGFVSTNAGANGTVVINIPVPAGASLGNTRMRVRGGNDSALLTSQACGASSSAYGETEDYIVNIIACTINPTVTTPSNKTIASGTSTTFTSTIANSPISFIWEVSTDGGTNYSIITNGGVYSTATTATLTITAAPSSMTGFKYRIKATNACGSTTSAAGNLTVSNVYCTATSTTYTTDYINSFESTGTLQDMVSNSSTGNTVGGYDDNTSIVIAKQISGGAVNFNIGVSEVTRIRIYVDWNSDGDFSDTDEIAYTTNTIGTGDTSFGFKVPLSLAAGNYRLRLRTGTSGTLGPCENPAADGETEDFTISIVSDCASKISLVTGGTNCGTGTVSLSASSGGGATEFRWYSAKTGGTLLGTTATGSWTTPSIPTTTTYYVSSYNGSCESLIRVAVKAIIYPVANIAFSPALPTICGSGTILTIGASGDSAIEDLFTENFEGGTLGNFSLNTISFNLSEVWNVKTSSYLPTNTSVFKPAINSGGAGTTGNKFAFTTSDLGSGSTINSAIETISSINTSGFTDLKLSFDHYYSHYGSSDKIVIEVSTNGGTTWSATPVITYSADDGSAGNFATKTVDFTPYINQATLKFRFRYSAGWDEGYALDNVKLFGTKPLTTTFVWGGTSVADLYSDAAATLPYNGTTPLATVYAKPNVTTGTSWEFTAQTTLPNGCLINKTITVPNNTKTWNGSVNSNYNAVGNWYPPGKPSAVNCVEISNVTPGPIVSDEALAYNLTLTNAASVLNIVSGNTIAVTDKVTVTAGGTFNIANNASLIQINNVANIGNINMTRITQPMYRADYSYWGSPVTMGTYTLGNLSPSSSAFYTWTPSVGGVSGNWVSASSATAINPIKGYIVRAPDTFSSSSATKVPYTATFIGTPNNGDILAPISYGSMGVAATDDKWNLVGNPYPSAISANAFIGSPSNTPLIGGTIYFWTHNSPPSAGFIDPFYGDFAINYTANDYASWNILGSTATAATSVLSLGILPNGYIAAGASFFVKSLGVAGSVTFNNSMRNATYNNSQFFKPANSTKASTGDSENKDFEKHRIWLNLSNNSGAFNQILVGYAQGATLEMDRDFDGTRFSTSGVTLYSLVSGVSLGIQGRPLPFDPNDQVVLGYNASAAGTLSVRIDHVDGIFDTQNIYLEDKTLQVIHNLKLTPYVFTTERGNFNNRFILRYTNKTLATDMFEINNTINVIVNENVTVKSSGQTIKSIEVFDILGRKIDAYKKVNVMQFTLNHLNKTSTGLIVKITLDDDTIVNRKIIF